MALPEVDVLVTGAHPDDAEFAMGGTLCRLQRQGYRLGLIDLTRGEMGSKGTPERRHQEAMAAAQVYGALFRVNLDLGDGNIADDVMIARKVATLIRECRPKLIFTHHGEDRHPDHRGCHALVSRAFFQSTLKALDLGVPFHCPDRLIFFPSNEWLEPDFVVDVTEVWEQKIRALKAFESQFVEPSALIDQKYFGVTEYAKLVEARCRMYGQRIRTTFGEGFVTQDSIAIRDLVKTFHGE